VLHHDRLIGKVDAAADRKTGHLVVQAVHRDITFTRAISAAVDAELDALAKWLELEMRAADSQPARRQPPRSTRPR
jgi:uncharacterized protein YcaQ